MAAITKPVSTASLARDLDAAFPDLVRFYQDRIFSGVYRLVPGPADAEDVAQETFVRAYRALRSYDEDRIRSLDLSSWLWTIALNLCRNAARSRARKPPGAPLDTVAEPIDGADTAVAAIESITSAEWQQRLASLPRPLRTAVVLRHVVGLGYREIGAVVDRPIGTVKSDVHRAVSRLSAMLEKEERDLR